jgi:hypothetical protein
MQLAFPPQMKNARNSCTAPNALTSDRCQQCRNAYDIFLNNYEDIKKEDFVLSMQFEFHFLFTYWIIQYISPGFGQVSDKEFKKSLD